MFNMCRRNCGCCRPCRPCRPKRPACCPVCFNVIIKKQPRCKEFDGCNSYPNSYHDPCGCNFVICCCCN